MRAWDAPAELARLDYGAPGILKQAERLLIDAGWFDPLENWLPVIRHATFQAWDSFTHEARLAIDFRVAAELLLMCYEDLVKARVAEPIPKIPLRAPHPLHNRLNGDRQTLDADLTDFGLSPHPLIVLVLEGKTEMFLIPAALKAAGFDISHSTIQIINGEGAGRDLSPLIAPLIAPEVTEFASDSEFLMVKRPATRLAIATDSEKLYTDTQREPTRRKYVKAIAEVMKQTQGAKVPDDQLDGLVSVYTWGSLCLEFACFTDRQLASAITRLKGVGRPPVTHLEVKQARNGPDPNAALARLLKRDWTVKKPDLAQALVPVVERQIARAMKRNSFGTSPIASLLLHIQKEAREIRAERTILKGSL